MIFHSIEYFLLLAVSVSLYFAMPHRGRWAVLLAASYWFYGSWRVDYLGLLVLSTTIDWLCGLGLDREERPAARRALLAASLAGNLGILGYFKYRLFFGETLGLIDPSGPAGTSLLTDFILPVGLSFYTLQSMGYTIDVFRRERRAERHPGYFALYVAFFPQLVAGPIERARNLLPQLRAEHRFDWDLFRLGGLLILYGLFKKLVVADRLSPTLAAFYADPAAATPGEAILACLLGMPFVYMDFSAYTDIARGSAMLMGVRLTRNFDAPILATNFGDFWRRWHISLSRWVRDYLYRPLARRREGRRWRDFSILVAFTAIGLWHGAAWTFVLFGLCQGVMIVVERAVAGTALGWPAGPWWDRLRMARTFVLFNLTGLLFLAPDLATAGTALERIAALAGEGFGDPAAAWRSVSRAALAGLLAIGAMRFLADRHGLSADWLLARPLPLRWGTYYALVLAIVLLQAARTEEFVYFQF